MGAETFPPRSPAERLGWTAVLAIAFAYVEAAVVAYLRALYYPEGFGFPVKPIDPAHLGIELGREGATIVMLVSVGLLGGRRAAERFGIFAVAFGLWDLFYYLWLKLLLDWPASLGDWDLLFLIPAPWSAPVAAPCAVALFLAVGGALIVLDRGRRFRPRASSGIAALGGTALILYSFLEQAGRIARGQAPEPYRYGLLAAGLALYLVAFGRAWGSPAR